MTRECDFCDTIEIKTEVDGKIVSNLITRESDIICQPCLDKEKSVSSAPININEVLTKARDIDNRVQVRTDLFNAATVSIVELKKAIDSDDKIQNKPFALASTLTERFNHYKQVIFELNEKVVEASNQQKAIQIYLNNLANSLRAEEREKLKLQDINYKPRDIKMPVTPKAIKMSNKRLDKVELRKYASLLGIAEFTLQMIVIQKNLTVVQAYELIKRNLAAAKEVK